MNQKQLWALFVCSLVPWTVGNGLVPLLPVYATRLGANPTTAGNYMAFSYLAIALGAVSAGWVSDRFGARKFPILLAGLVGVPTAWLIGSAGNIWSLSLLTAVLWFSGGIGLGLISILTGLSAKEHERGKIFGILSLTSGLGALLGGLASGYIVDRWGFQTLFSAIALFLVFWPVSAGMLTEIKTRPEALSTNEVEARPRLSRSYFFLFSASLVASIAGFITLLGRSLLMSALAFNATAISITGAVSGIIAMPLPLLVGWLSDRTGRKIFLYAAYLVGIASLAMLAAAASLWHFSVAIALQAIFVGVNATVGNALVTDILPPASLGRGLALFGATSWIGGVLGFAGGGLALQHLGVTPTILLGISLPLIAMGLLVPVGTCRVE